MKKMMFNDRYGLTQAVLEGRKTMTRRLVKDANLLQWLHEMEVAEYAIKGTILDEYSKYKVGEVVAVAQSYKNLAEQSLKSGFVGDNIDYQIHFKNHKGWDNKMFVKADLMPHRIRITDIKVERLQDCSGDDCLKEGMICEFNDPLTRGWGWDIQSLPFDETYQTPKEAFAALIDKVSGKGTWESNPWVFVYTFELKEGGEE